MLVEINLLPQKEPKKIAFIIFLTIFLVILLFAGAYYYYQINSTNGKIDTVSREISMTQKIREKAEQKNSTEVDSGSVSELKSAIEWADTYPIQTIPVMRHLTSLLPERGFIQSFSYTEAGTISLTVQFDSTREAAFFLNSLHDSEWIEDASLGSITATAQEDSTAEGNTETTSVSGSSTETAQAGATTTGTETVVTSTNQEKSTESTDSQSNAAVGTTSNSSNTTNSVSTTGTTNQSTTAVSPKAKSISSPYLPRYTGQYEITLNKTKVKEIAQKNQLAGEGVSGS